MTVALISGATGYAGQFIVERCLADGFDVIAFGRSQIAPETFSGPVEWIPGDLVPDHDFASAFDGVDVFIHAAFSHVPGRYRGGEGDNPEEFRRLNVNGTLSLFEAAKRAGVARAVFLSSRAVYGLQPPGADLTEMTTPRPDTLYGEVKLEAESRIAALADDTFLPVSLRATGIYGASRPGGLHKWQDLFAGFRNGEKIEPRVATEVHGADLADAVMRVARADAEDLGSFGTAPVLNVSDIILDRRDLLSAYGEATGNFGPLPDSADPSALNVMDCSRLRSLGWEPRGALDLTGLA